MYNGSESVCSWHGCKQAELDSSYKMLSVADCPIALHSERFRGDGCGDEGLTHESVSQETESGGKILFVSKTDKQQSFPFYTP